MSRIDITVYEKASEKLVANRAFCREPHLAAYCGRSNDEKLQQLHNDVSIGLSIQNMDSFLDLITYVQNYLGSETGKAENTDAFSDNEASRMVFIAELEDAKDYLITLQKQEHFDDLSIEIA